LSTLSQSDRAFYRGIARIGLQVVEALEYANRQGILHRDIKPSNLLLDTRGNVWVTDFGLAKAADSDDLTHTGDILGTIRYMAPERFRGRCDARSDVYSLGLTLYELVALRPAYDGSDRNRLIDRVLHEEPERLRKLVTGLPRDLETIIAKATAREPSQRYPTAGAVAEDLRRFLAGEPILARRAGAWERGWRWCRRNPALAALAAAVVTLLAAVATIATIASIQYRLVVTNEVLLRIEAQNRAEAEARAKEKLEASHYFQSIALAHLELSRDDLGRAREQLDACPRALRQWEWYYLDRLCRLDPLIIRDEAEVKSVAFSPDGDRLASAGAGGTIKIRDSKTGEVVRTLGANTDSVRSVAFHPGGKLLASSGREVEVWDLTTARAVFTRPGFSGEQNGTTHVVAFSPDGRRLAAGDEGVVNVWDWRNDQLLHTLPGHEKRAVNVAFSPDGRRLASASWRGDVMIWDINTGQRLLTLSEHHHPVSALAFSPDGRRLVSASFDRRLIVWDAETGERLRILRGHGGLVLGVAVIAFRPDGSRLAPDDWRLASVGEDRTVRIWEVATGRLVLSLREHADMCQSVAVSPDGRRLATAGRDATVRLWDATPLRGNESQEVRTFQQAGEIWTLALSPDGQRVASAGLDTPVKVWEIRSDREPFAFAGHPSVVFSVAWHPDGRRIASAGWNAGRTKFIVKVWDARTGREAFSLPAGGESFAVAFSPPDGRHLVTAGASQTVQVWDAQTGRAVGTLGAHDRIIRGLVFSRDGRHLASAGSDGTVKLWDWDATRLGEPREARRTIRARAPQVGFNLGFSPDGWRLVAGGEGNTVKIWDVRTGRELHTLSGHRGDVWAAAFSPDPGGRWVASAGEDSTVKVWDSHTGTLVRSFRGHTGLVTSVTFSPDGRHLVSGSRDQTVRVWDVAPLVEPSGGGRAPVD
jgi:WD40 repeat protein